MTTPPPNRVPSLLVDLAKQCVEDSERWFGDQGDGVTKSIPYHALALAGEVGEFCNIIKKIERGSLNFGDSHVRYDLVMELTDVFIYLLNIAALLKVDLNESYKIKRATNQARFSEQRLQREARS